MILDILTKLKPMSKIEVINCMNIPRNHMSQGLYLKLQGHLCSTESFIPK